MPAWRIGTLGTTEATVARALGRTTQWLAALVLVSGCAGADPEGDASTADDADGGMIAPIGPVAESQLLYFTLEGDGWLSTSAGTEAREICPDARPYPNADGSRALCVPATDEISLGLFDIGSQAITTGYDDWELVDDEQPPLIAPDGTRVAYRTRNEDNLSLVQVADDGSNPIGSIEGYAPVAFTGDDALLIETAPGAPALWSVGAPVAQEFAGDNAVATGPSRPGVIFEVRGEETTIRFLDVFGMTTDLVTGELRLGDVLDRRVLILPRGAEGEIVLLDLLDPSFRATATIERPSIGSSAEIRLVAPSLVMIEESKLVRCGNDRLPKVNRTKLIAMSDGSETVLAETDPDGHRAQVSADGRRALVVELDGCGVATGVTRLVNLVDGEEAALGDFVIEPILAAAISANGGYVAVSLASGVQVIDLRVDPPQVRVAASGVMVGTELVFR